VVIRNDKLTIELRESRDRLVADCNRDHYIQKLVTEHELQLKEAKQRNGQLEDEIHALNERLNQEVRNIHSYLNNSFFNNLLCDTRQTLLRFCFIVQRLMDELFAVIGVKVLEVCM
jgi:molecular chaperone GrpE (heat shock protein)